ncbi:uncharacterized protein LOC119737791 [Patiria miniata]|uniref:Uncharacterized protein n=1 Tax=Patiria miniata TaxID=46514 RepID=A0A914AXB2_PATMI|nr:uncharacterized protein LOC119737791 [Patiria miniata]XP_038068332.1 uncharacterized protein LOC119737791 [Patiria miniata]
MKVSCLCAVLLWTCWQFNSPVTASSAAVDASRGGDPQTYLQAEASRFTRQLDQAAMGEHGRFQRSLNGLQRHRVRRSSGSDFRHGFYPATGVGNREDFELSSVDLISNTSAVNSTVIEWGYIEVGVNETIVTASTDEGLQVFQLDLQEPNQKLSRIKTFPNVLSSVLFSRHSWQAGHIVRTKQYLTVYDSRHFLSHYSLEKGNNITLQDSVDLGPVSVIDLHHFDFGMVTYVAALTSNGFVRLYRWSSRYCKFSVAEDLTVPLGVSNLQAFHISGRHYLLVSIYNYYSTIFKYHSRQSSFRSYQRLYPDGAKHATHFTDAYNHYLVFIDALGLSSTFFKWNGVEFEEMQVISTVGANHWHAVPIPGTQDGALLILSSDGKTPGALPLTAYKHDPVTDTFLSHMSVNELLNPPELHNATSTLSFDVGSDIYLLVGFSKSLASKDPGDLFKMNFLYTETDDPIVAENQQLEDMIEALKNKTSYLNESLSKAEEAIAGSVTKDGNQRINGTKTFTEVDLRKALVERIDVEDAFIFAPRPTGNESLGHLVNQSYAQREQIEEFLDFLTDVVTLGTDQNITGAKNITSVTVQGALNSTVFSTELFDDVDIDKLNREAFRLDMPNQVINGELTFSGNLSSTKSIDLDDSYLVNGLDLSEDVVVTVGSQTITGTKTFQQDTSIQNDMVLNPGVLLNNIDPSDQLVTLTGPHIIAGELNFTDVIHIDGDIITSGTIDGVDVSSLCDDVLTISTDQTVPGNISFQQAPVFDTDVVYGGLLRQVNITRLDDEAVKINEDTNITGAKTFMDDISVTGDVIVDGLVSNIDLKEDVVQLAVGGRLSGSRVFSGLVEMAGVVTVTGTVNGLDLSQDVVTLYGDHTIQGKKTFSEGITANKNINVTGTVDTVDLSEWAANVMTLSTDQTVQGPLAFTDDTNMGGNLTVAGLINGIDLLAMYKDTFFKTSDKVQIISGNKTFTKPVNVTTGHIVFEGLINGRNMTEDYLNKFSDQNVTGHKTFVDGFSADADLNVSGLIAGIDLLALYANSLIRGREAHLRGERTFLGNVKVEGVVNVTGTVDGIKMSTNVLTINGNQIVTGSKTFQQLKAHNMSSVNMIAQVSVNQRNWTDFVLSRVDLTSNQDISANHSFTADNVTANDVEIKWHVNGINLTAVLEDIMRKSVVQTVTGSKTIPGTVIVHGNVSLSDHINGILLGDFASRAFLLSGLPQTVTGRKTFDNATAFSSHLLVTGLVDGIDLDFFMSDILHPDNLRKILGTKTFLNGFRAQTDVAVTGNVDGVDLSEDVMTTNTSQNVSGTYTMTFLGSTDPDSLVTGLINGIDLVYLNNTILKRQEDQTVNAPLVFTENLTSMTDVTVTGLVDGEDLSELLFRAIMLNDPFNVTGNLTFTEGVTFEGPLNTTGLIFGKNLSAWYQDVVLLNTDEVVLGNKTFISDVDVSPALSVTDEMEADTVFGQNFDNFVADAVNLTSNVTITGAKTFLGDVQAQADVSVDGTVDGIRIEDVVTKDGDQVITGVKTFTKTIDVNGHINITGLVNGVNISDLYERTFKLDSPQNVTAVKKFTQDLEVTDDVIITGSVDGIDLSEEAVPLGTDQTIEGDISFTTNVTVNGNMTVGGYVDGVNLTHLVTERATLSGDENVRSDLTFLGHVTFRGNVTVRDLFDGVPLQTLWDLHEHLLKWIRVDIENLLLISADQCHDVKLLQWAYAHTVEMLAHVSQIQEVEIQIQSFESFVLDDVTHLALAVHSNTVDHLCVDSYVYAWDADTDKFVQKASFATNGAYNWHAFERRETVYLAVANEGTNPCNGDASVNNTIYYYNGSQFLEYQDLVSEESREIDTTVINDDLYLAVANTKTSALSYLYLLAADGLFYEAQNFSIGGATSVEFLQAGNTTFLVFAAVSPTQSPIYIFNNQSGQFDFHQYVSTSYATAVDGFMFRHEAGLAFANHAELFDNNKISWDVPIEVYFLSRTSGEFELHELVDFTAAVDVKMFHIGPDLYMAAVSEYEELQILKYEGFVGFSPVVTLASYGVVSVEVFELIGASSYENLFFAIGIDPVTTDDVYSRILAEKVIGQTVMFKILPCPVVVEESFHGDPSLLDRPLDD